MNIGQIYETVLGWAGLKLGRKFSTPIFDGATLDQINELTEEAGVPKFGHTYFMMVELVKDLINQLLLELFIC